MANDDIFDKISEENFVSGKRKNRAEAKKGLNSEKSGSVEPCSSNASEANAILAIENLAKCMQNGFNAMTTSMTNLGEQIMDRFQEMDYNEDDNNSDDCMDCSSGEEEPNIFNEIADEQLGEKVGPEINQQLGNMVNKLLKTQMIEKVA